MRRGTLQPAAVVIVVKRHWAERGVRRTDIHRADILPLFPDRSRLHTELPESLLVSVHGFCLGNDLGAVRIGESLLQAYGRGADILAQVEARLDALNNIVARLVADAVVGARVV